MLRGAHTPVICIAEIPEVVSWVLILPLTRIENIYSLDTRLLSAMH